MSDRLTPQQRADLNAILKRNKPEPIAPKPTARSQALADSLMCEIRRMIGKEAK